MPVKSLLCMSLRAFQIGVFVLTLLAFAAWLGVLLKVDPEGSGLLGRGLFFGSLFAFVLGLVMEGMIGVYRKGLGEERAAQYIGSAFRQTTLLTLFFFLNIALVYRGIWVWWLALLFFAFVLLLEFTARTLKQEKRTDNI